jgi:hypothetical protein
MESLLHNAYAAKDSFDFDSITVSKDTFAVALMALRKARTLYLKPATIIESGIRRSLWPRTSKFKTKHQYTLKPQYHPKPRAQRLPKGSSII